VVPNKLKPLTETMPPIVGDPSSVEGITNDSSSIVIDTLGLAILSP
jgi:hypothetical protein